MTQKLKQFIQENKNLINQNSKESWEEIYDKIPYGIAGEFTETILNTGINDPASIMGYIPKNYLYISNIANYKIPENVKSIGSFAFRSCESLPSVIIPNSVVSIGDHAFAYCYNLTSITIPDSVTQIDSCAFYYCKSLTSVTIGDDVTIGEEAFRGCSNLKEINFKGTKKQAITLGIGNKSEKSWREGSLIEKAICIDGEINLK